MVKSARAYECVPFFMTEKKVPIKFLANENNIRAALGTDAAKNEKARSERTQIKREKELSFKFYDDHIYIYSKLS